MLFQKEDENDETNKTEQEKSENIVITAFEFEF